MLWCRCWFWVDCFCVFFFLFGCFFCVRVFVRVCLCGCVGGGEGGGGGGGGHVSDTVEGQGQQSAGRCPDRGRAFWDTSHHQAQFPVGTTTVAQTFAFAEMIHHLRWPGTLF